MFDVAIIGGGYLGLILAGIISKSGAQICLIEERSYSKLSKMKNVYRKAEIRMPDRLFAISLGSCNILKHHKICDFADVSAQEIKSIVVTESDIAFSRICDRRSEESQCSKIYISDEQRSISLNRKYYKESKITFAPKDVDAKCFGYMIQETDLLNLLWKKISEHQNIQVIDDSKLINIEEDHFGVVRLSTKDSTIKAACAIATDGKFSSIRKILKLKTHKKSYGQIGIVCDIWHEYDHLGVAREIFMDSGPLAVLPKVGGHYSSIVWTESEDVRTLITSLSTESIESLLQERIGDSLGEIKLQSRIACFPLFLQKSDDYFCGNIVFAGDALHAIHPLAGQGLNLGIRDASVLGSLILDNINLGLEPGALNAFAKYKLRRFNDVNLMMQMTDSLNSLFSNDFLPIKLLRGFGMQAVDNMPILKKKFTNYAMYGDGSAF